MFTQFTLNQSINQTRGIFDTYSYRTEDSIDEVTTTGYFAHSRFIPDADGSFDWRGAIINCECAEGFFTVRVLQDSISAETAGQDALKVVEVSTNYTQLPGDDVIYATATLEITLIDPATAYKQLTIRSISGTTTITPSSGTVETTTLTVGQSITLGPRATGFFNL